MRRIGLVTFLGAGALILGCSNDDTGGKGSGPKNSGVESDKLLTSMTRQEVFQLCAFERDTYKASLTSEEQYCFRTSIDQASSCERDLAECIASDDHEDELADDWDCENLALKDYLEPARQCTATIAQFEACDRARNAQLRDHFNRSRCNNAESLVPPQTEPKACIELFAVCPSLID